MKFNVYDKGLNLVAIIGENYVSALWQEDYNDAGAFTLELQNSSYWSGRIKPDFFVSRNDRKTIMQIKTVEISKNIIVASGFSASKMLDDLVYIGTIESGTNIPEEIKLAYESTIKIENFEIPQNDDLYIEAPGQISNQSFFNIVKTLSQQKDLGFRSVKEDKKINLEFFQPQAKSELVFSRKYGNLLEEKVLMSTSLYKNYAVVLGSGEGSERKYAIVDLSNGETRREMVVDARHMVYDEEESEEEYTKRLYDKGLEELNSRTKTWNFTFDLNPVAFGKTVDLGDVVTILSEDVGERFQGRIAKFNEQSQNNQTTVKITVGEITKIKR